MSAVPTPDPRSARGADRATQTDPRGVRADLALAEAALVEAEWATSPAARFAAAQVAALRMAAVVLAARAHPRASSRPRNVWSLLADVAPEYAEWAGYFAVTQATSVAAREALATHAHPPVTTRQADDLLRDAQAFHEFVARRVGWAT